MRRGVDGHDWQACVSKIDNCVGMERVDCGRDGTGRDLLMSKGVLVEKPGGLLDHHRC